MFFKEVGLENNHLHASWYTGEIKVIKSQSFAKKYLYEQLIYNVREGYAIEHKEEKVYHIFPVDIGEYKPIGGKSFSIDVPYSTFYCDKYYGDLTDSICLFKPNDEYFAKFVLRDFETKYKVFSEKPFERYGRIRYSTENKGDHDSIYLELPLKQNTLTAQLMLYSSERTRLKEYLKNIHRNTKLE